LAGSPETLTYLHTDHLGTPKFGTDATGTQVWAWAPDAFGGGAPSGSVTVNLRMAGQYYDAESTLFYNWNRYYNPATGRYISSDPIGLEGGINTFLYAAASPVMYIDPEGLQAALACVAGPNPVCIAGIGQIVSWIAGGASLAAVMSVPGDTPECIDNTSADEKPSAAACNTALKLLKNVIRLSGKFGGKLSEKQKKILEDKIKDGTITSDDLPGKIRDEFPGELKGKSLREIQRICGKT
jgi:RHS repeat-associated protein